MKKINEPLYDADAEDQTVITSLPDSKKQKRKKRLIACLAAVVFVCATTIFFIFGKNDNSLPDESKTEQNPVTETENPVKPAVATDQSVQNDTMVETPAIDPKQENYNISFSNALAAFNAENYEKAAKFIEEAESYMVTNDTKKYKKLCNDELEKIEIQKRRNSYESLMEFGNFVVVKKKSNGLYGAIDDKGIEVIKCVYIMSEPLENNRLFQRSDFFYDKYDSSGKLLAEKISGLE
jgi:serine/threonine-protein kinase